MWWNSQSREMQDKVRVLVKEKRLEFSGGGWVQNDEACPYFEDIIE